MRKETLVEVDFEVNNREYVVRRGIKPNVFDIQVNGELLHREADDRTNQKILEENILKVNYKSFTQIVILGSSAFVPFMQLTAPNRREVIEDLLDIRIFSSMNNFLKDKVRIEKEQIKSLDLKKDNIKDKILMQENFMKELEEQGKTSVKANQDKITTLIDDSEYCSNSNQELEVKVSDLTKEQEKLSGSSQKLLKLNNLKGKITQKVSTITKEHKFFRRM